MIERSKTVTETSKERFLQITAAFFILLFTYTAVSKLIEVERFSAVISTSPLLGSFAQTLAWLLPIIEITISGLLFFQTTRKYGFAASVSLIAVFTAYIGYMLVSSSHLPCSCGGVIENMSWQQHLYFNLGLTILSGVATYLENNHKLFIAINRES